MVKKVPMRQCLGCRESKPKSELVRIVHSEDTFAVDASGKMNGRGAYICMSKACLEKAMKSKALDRSFKMSIPKAVCETLSEEMIKLYG